MPIRYLIDENLSPVYADQLRRREPALDVYAAGEPGAPAKGTPDPDILCWCEEHAFILVTNNRSSMPGHLAEHLAQGRHILGILVFAPDRSMSDMLDELLLIAGASTEGEYQDCIEYLPVS